MTAAAAVPPRYATADPKAIAGFVADGYGLDSLPAATLLNRGFNDTYEIRTEDGKRFIARVSGDRLGGVRDVEAETAFIRHLERGGVPVAPVVPALDGMLFQTIDLPQGPRPLVLFHYLDGRVPDLESPQDACLQGTTLARLHDCAEVFSRREDGAVRLDLGHLLHGPADAILASEIDEPEAKGELAALTVRLADRVEAVDRELTRTRCHGDCHGLNARIVAKTAQATEAFLFDFDDGGFGYLAYDLAVHLWAQISFGRRRQAIWHGFDRGYRSVRALGQADEAAIPLFVAIRHIWLLGQFADKARTEWGAEHFSTVLLRREVSWLLGFERQVLSPGLV